MSGIEIWEPRPLPTGYPETAEFWEAATEERLVLRTCRECGTTFHYPRSFCPDCFSEDVDWIESSGRGEVYSYSVIHQMSGWPEDDLPVVLAYVELEEGVRFPTHVVDAAPDAVEIGRSVEVAFVPTKDEEVAIPVFELAE